MHDGQTGGTVAIAVDEGGSVDRSTGVRFGVTTRGRVGAMRRRSARSLAFAFVLAATLGGVALAAATAPTAGGEVPGHGEIPSSLTTDNGAATPLLTPQPAWTCSAYGYLFQSPNGLAVPHDIYQVTLATGASTLYGTTAGDLNDIGFNTLDDYMYGRDISTKQFVRIGADGSLVGLGNPLSTLKTTSGTTGYDAGDFDSTGDLFISSSAVGRGPLGGGRPGNRVGDIRPPAGPWHVHSGGGRDAVSR